MRFFGVNSHGVLSWCVSRNDSTKIPRGMNFFWVSVFWLAARDGPAPPGVPQSDRATTSGRASRDMSTDAKTKGYGGTDSSPAVSVASDDPTRARRSPTRRETPDDDDARSPRHPSCFLPTTDRSHRPFPTLSPPRSSNHCSRAMPRRASSPSARAAPTAAARPRTTRATPSSG
jgi:hypothetical protein